jgi:hypothetical protein
MSEEIKIKYPSPVNIVSMAQVHEHIFGQEGRLMVLALRMSAMLDGIK